MSAEILDFNGVTSLDIDPDRVLTKAVGKMQGVVVLGYDQDGDFYFASSFSDGGDVVWLFEVAKKKLLEAAS